MRISLNVALDALRPYNLDIRTAVGSNPSFSRCLPLPGDAQQLDRNNIYVGGLSNALALTDRHPDVCCICVRDRIKDSCETDESLSGLVIVNENISRSDLLTLLVTRFFTITDWVRQMYETILHNGSIQDIVDLSAPIFDNFIAINDASLKMMAYTKSIPCDDPIYVSFVEKGYHSEEVVQTFRKRNLLKTWEMETSIFINDHCNVIKYPTLNKVFRCQNMYFMQVVLTCNRHPITPCLTDLFGIFTDLLAVYTERMCKEIDTRHSYDTFLIDLIEGNITSSKTIEERAQYVGLPVTGQFFLCKIIPGDTANLYIGKMLQEFSQLFPRFKYVRYRQSIVAIHHFATQAVEDQVRSICDGMASFLHKYYAFCGVSFLFNNLGEIPFAYQQAMLAIKYSELLRGRDIYTSNLLGDPQDSHINFFSRNYIHCLLGECEMSADIWHHSEYCRLLHKLHERDKQNKTSYIQLLYIYLSYSLNATDTGKILKIHRNNVVYHIERIKELLGVDLDNPTVRFMLQISIVLSDLYGFRSDQ